MFPLSKRDKAVAKITLAVLVPLVLIGAISAICYLIGRPLSDGVARQLILAGNIFAGLTAGNIYTGYRMSTEPKLSDSI